MIALTFEHLQVIDKINLPQNIRILTEEVENYLKNWVPLDQNAPQVGRDIWITH